MTTRQTRITATVSLLLLGSLACDPAAPAPPEASAPEGAKSPEAQALARPAPEIEAEPEAATETPEDLTALWAEIVAIEDEAKRVEREQAFAESWRAKRYTWQGAMVSGMCLRATRTCAINVFDRAGDPNVGAIGGFLPRVSFEPEAWEAIARGCAGQTQCVVTFEGTLTRVMADPNMPLQLDFTQGRAVEARPLGDGEQWFDGKPDAQLDPKIAARRRKKLRTGDPTRFDASVITTSTF